MNLQVEAPFQISAPLQQLVEEKVNKLETFFDRITSAHVFFKDEINRIQHKDQRTIDIRIEVPGNSLFASASSDSFEKSIADAAQKMERQLKKYKQSLTH
jgi:putative sigma-54 modulation protein